MLFPSPQAGDGFGIKTDLTGLGPCDVHARFDASGPAYIGVYDRTRERWLTSTDQTLTLDVAVAALAAIRVHP